jgi:RNA polymerase sigma-70 factor, ECF subfamily
MPGSSIDALDVHEATPSATLSRRALTGVIDRSYRVVYDYLCWMTRDASLAADLTEETFLAIWRHPPELRRNRSLRPWVLKVALNAYRQHLRRRGVPSAELTEAAEDVPDPRPDPLKALTRAEAHQAIRQAVLDLPEPYREVVVLHSLEGLTLREASEALGVPLGTAKSRLATAFARLRCALLSWEE